MGGDREKLTSQTFPLISQPSKRLLPTSAVSKSRNSTMTIPLDLPFGLCSRNWSSLMRVPRSEPKARRISSSVVHQVKFEMKMEHWAGIKTLELEWLLELVKWPAPAPLISELNSLCLGPLEEVVDFGSLNILP